MTTTLPVSGALGLTHERAGATGREIAQQPAVWREVAADAAARRDEVARFLTPVLALPDLRIVLTGAGTSAFAGEMLAPALRRELGRRVDAVATTDIVANPDDAFSEDVPTLLVSFARSGDSPESIAATELAERCLTSVHHIVVTCNAAGRLAVVHGESARSLVLHMPPATHDAGFAMTSSLTSMVLGTWVALVPSALDAAVVEVLARAAEHVLATFQEDVAALASRGCGRIVYLGSGSLAALAKEAALKVLELTAGGVVGYAESSLGFRHGPKSILDGNTVAVVFLSNDDYTVRYDEDIVDELRQDLGDDDVVAVTARTAPGLAGQVWHVPGLDAVPDALAGVVFVLLAQVFALDASIAVGITPDTPSPSGQVNRVVKGVTVYPLEGGR